MILTRSERWNEKKFSKIFEGAVVNFEPFKVEGFHIGDFIWKGFDVKILLVYFQLQLKLIQKKITKNLKHPTMTVCLLPPVPQVFCNLCVKIQNKFSFSFYFHWIHLISSISFPWKNITTIELNRQRIATQKM